MNTTGSKLAAQEIIASEVPSPLHIRHAQNDLWENWGRTARCQPEFSFYPECVEDLIQIIQFARERDKRIRVVGSGHSWSGLVPTDGVLVYVQQLNNVSIDLSDDSYPRVVIERIRYANYTPRRAKTKQQDYNSPT